MVQLIDLLINQGTGWVRVHRESCSKGWVFRLWKFWHPVRRIFILWGRNQYDTKLQGCYDLQRPLSKEIDTLSSRRWILPNSFRRRQNTIYRFCIRNEKALSQCQADFVRFKKWWAKQLSFDLPQWKNRWPGAEWLRLFRPKRHSPHRRTQYRHLIEGWASNRPATLQIGGLRGCIDSYQPLLPKPRRTSGPIEILGVPWLIISEFARL